MHTQRKKIPFTYTIHFWGNIGFNYSIIEILFHSLFVSFQFNIPFNCISKFYEILLLSIIERPIQKFDEFATTFWDLSLMVLSNDRKQEKAFSFFEGFLSSFQRPK